MGVQGTPDDEEADYGDLWTGLTEANTSVYGLAAGAVPAAPTELRIKRGFLW